MPWQDDQVQNRVTFVVAQPDSSERREARAPIDRLTAHSLVPSLVSFSCRGARVFAATPITVGPLDAKDIPEKSDNGSDWCWSGAFLQARLEQTKLYGPSRDLRQRTELKVGYDLSMAPGVCAGSELAPVSVNDRPTPSSAANVAAGRASPILRAVARYACWKPGKVRVNPAAPAVSAAPSRRAAAAG